MALLGPGMGHGSSAEEACLCAGHFMFPPPPSGQQPCLVETL